MPKGVVPGPKVAKADKGTMVETLVEMLAPVEEPPRAPVATALSCWLRAASWAFCWALACWVAAEEFADSPVLPPAALVLEEVLAMTKAPPAAAVAWVPFTAPPEVEMNMSCSVSGLCQKDGATSMITWYWFLSL